jgi:hypothetical protein
MMTAKKSDAFISNLKVVSNNIHQTLDPLERAYYATDNPDDYRMVEQIVEQLSQIRKQIIGRLDNS